MAAELITYSPSLGQGLGQLLNIGRELSQMSLVITSITLILAVGVAIELLVFAPLERRVLTPPRPHVPRSESGDRRQVAGLQVRAHPHEPQRDAGRHRPAAPRRR